MSLQVEKLEHSMAKLTIEASPEDFEKAVQKVYQKERGKITIPGFRKGKAPRNLIEKMYGKGVFYEDAANELIPETYSKELEAHPELEVVSRPRIDVVQIESGKPFIFTAEVALKPEIELGKYKGVKCTKIDTSVSEEEVDAELEKQRVNNSRIVDVEDRPVQDKDIVTIDYEGFMDGTPFDGGKGTDHELTIGSHSFIDTFEDQLIGKNKGDDCEVNVTFPEDYHEKSLAGKPALFQVSVKRIKERQIPELDDDFASDVSEFETLAEYREDTRRKLQERKEADAKAKKEDEIVKAIIEDSNMDIPDAMVETEGDQLYENQAMRFSQQGLSMEMYLRFSGMTEEQLREQMRDQARTNIEGRLVLEAIAKAEGFEAAEEEIDAEFERMAGMYRMEPEQLKKLMGEAEMKSIRSDITIRKAVDLILQEAKEQEPKEEKKEEA